jgi:hypothetical protein
MRAVRLLPGERECAVLMRWAPTRDEYEPFGGAPVNRVAMFDGGS